MPAFLVPFVFVLDPLGVGLLLKVPKGGSWLDVVEIALTTAAGIAVLAFAFQGWALKRSTVLETGLFTLAGALLIFPSVIGKATQALLGLDLEMQVPGLAGIGLHIALHVVIGLAVALATILMQRARPA